MSCGAPTPTRGELERNPSRTRAQLARWGVSWPPPKGWRKRLLAEADRVYGTSPKPRNKRSTYRPLKPGDLHPAWPEWRWDGEKFVKSGLSGAERS